jgi:phosphoenolpyruvate phosphomutase
MARQGEPTGVHKSVRGNRVGKSRRLRELLESGRLVTVAGAHNGLTGVLAERAGFDAVWLSSFEISAARALPDMSILTMTEYLAAAVGVDRACDLPVIADCDTGFGTARNMVHMVREYEAAGIAAVCVEDKVFPKINSFAGTGQCLLDADEFAHRLAMAKKAQRSRDFMVIARTEAYIAGHDTTEALRRAQSYADAGADAVLVHSKKSSPEQITQFLDGWRQRCPVVVVPTTYPDWHVDDMAAAGVSMCIYANQGLRSMVSAIRRTLTSIKAAGTAATVEGDISSMQEIFDIQRVDEWLAMER